ncbi:MAG: hypothetical protein E6I52_13395 [Chloroflexi bacterium]|nr:MAG: hypothetical protein E6I52_13395 [Chloroflexota bacterium]
MNPFVEHQRQSVLIVGFLDKYRKVPSITKAYFREVSEDYHRFVAGLAATQRIPIVEPPKGVRREDWVEPFYQRFGSRFGIVVILKAVRTPALRSATRRAGVAIASRSARGSSGSTTFICDQEWSNVTVQALGTDARARRSR